MELFGILFFVLFFIVLGKNIAQWFKNENSPRLTVPARIVDMQRRTHHHHTGSSHHLSHSYHVTFEVDSGDRMELRVIRSEYEALAVGYSGKLTFQGTRYLGFEYDFEPGD